MARVIGLVNLDPPSLRTGCITAYGARAVVAMTVRPELGFPRLPTALPAPQVGGYVWQPNVRRYSGDALGA